MAEAKHGWKTMLLLALGLIAALAAAGCDDVKVKPNTNNAAYPPPPRMYTDGQNAKQLLGQSSFTTGGFPAGPNNNSLIMNSAGDGVVANNTLFLLDANSKRVMAYTLPLPTFATLPNPPAQFALGVADLNTANTLTHTAKDYWPVGLATDKGQLYVRDMNGGRVLVYKSIPTTDYVAADYAIFQSGPTSTTRSGCAPLGPGSLHPQVDNTIVSGDAISAGGGKLVVADSLNHRVLVFATPITGDDPAPILVLGQNGSYTQCTVNAGGVVQQGGVNQPNGVWTDGRRLAVVDTNNDRVLLWNHFPTVPTDLPDTELGQVLLIGFGGPVTGGTSATTFSNPYSVTSNGDQLFVADTGNNRVLIWNHWPTSNDLPADNVLGQTAMNLSVFTTSPFGMTNSYSLTLVGTDLVVGDQTNSRYMIW